MANPGYPMQPPPPMGGMPPPMGPPMGAMPNAMRPMRRGTSKAVPVVVSAGLAVGVFCGLLFGLGTGDEDAAAATTDGSGDQGSAVAEVPDILKPKPVDSDTPTPSAGTVATPGSGAPSGGSAAVATPGSGAGSDAGSAAPALKIVKLIIDVKPDAAAKAAKITVNGADVEATSDFDMGDDPKKKVEIVIKASGYKDYKYEGEVEAGKDTKFEFEMQKKPRPTSNLPRPETGGGKKPGNGKKPGGGLIDI